jgi:histidinol-phosphate/aromatic aminotransferase/cobyric acid decarboxylase-like protein
LWDNFFNIHQQVHIMSDLESKVLGILKDFGGESSMFLITNPSSPWGSLGDAAALTAAVNSLAAQGAVSIDAANDVVKAS